MTTKLYHDSKKEDLDKWFYSEKWRVHQKVNNEIYVYVSRLIYGWKAQAYLRGSVDFCTLEARTNDASQSGFEKMTSLGDEWLESYGDCAEAMKGNFFHIDYGEAWTSGEKEKRFWI